MNSKQHKIRVGISIGDYNGIGPEVILKTLKDKNITDFFTPIIFGSGKLFSYQKNVFKLQFNFNYITHASEAANGKINKKTRREIMANLGERKIAYVDIKRGDKGKLYADTIRYENWDAEAKRIEKIKKGGHH